MQTKEEKQEYNKQYRLKNREKLNANHKKYYSENKERVKEIALKCYYNTIEKRKEGMKEYRKNNLEKVRTKQKEWYKNNPDRVKEQKLRKEYNISLDQYNEMFEKQEGRCMICGKHQDDLKQKLAVDHCHKTKKIRGLLCNACNRGLGYLKDDPKIVENALKYLLIDIE